MTWYAGVDGCKQGWIAVFAQFKDGIAQNLEVDIVEDLDAVLNHPLQPELAALDIPIGLLDTRILGGRECDRLTRKCLGFPRSSSVFSPPARDILQAQSFDDVRGRGMTIQAWHILPKIRDVDHWMTPERQKRIFEAHPELAFWELAGRPMAGPKKRTRGRKERLDALAPFFPDIHQWAADNRPPRKLAAMDDLVDALVLTRVAWRKATGQAKSLPDTPPKDARNLDMAIWC